MSAAIIANAGEWFTAKIVPNATGCRTHGADVGNIWEGNMDRRDNTDVFHAGSMVIV